MSEISIGGRYYVHARRYDYTTTGWNGFGWLEVLAPSPAAALAQAQAQPWPVGAVLGVATTPNVHAVGSWVPANRQHDAQGRMARVGSR